MFKTQKKINFCRHRVDSYQKTMPFDPSIIQEGGYYVQQ